MKTRILLAALLALPFYGQTVSGIPHLQKQGTATQLIVDGKPFLALSGELGNNSATSLENMQPVWPKLVSGNLNCVLVALSWAQLEPAEGSFDFALVDGLIQEARRNNLKVVFLWFGSWKNGLSSYAPYWVKSDYTRFPRIRVKGGRSIELLSTFGDATRDADARAFGALMRHIREVDGSRHTVVMMQVENEVGVLRDSRDRSAAANQAFDSAVPKQLMDYLEKHKDTLAPELREVWAAHGFKTAGSWEEVFGAGKPDSVDMPVQTRTPPLSAEEYQTGWRQLHWPADEIFMAWNYSRYINAVVEAGKKEYTIPMFMNAWLQQPNMAWPGTYPSGGPLPQVHDVWRAGAPAADLLAPDLYLQYFDEVCTRFTRNANPLFIHGDECAARFRDVQCHWIFAVLYRAFSWSGHGISCGLPANLATDARDSGAAGEGQHHSRAFE
jgi:beta-galactosidase GanA